MRQVSLFLAMICISACQVKTENDSSGADSLTVEQSNSAVVEEKSVSDNSEFNQYISGFKVATLPFSAINPDSLVIPPKLNDPSDFKVIRGDRAFYNWWFYKRISTDGKFVAVITIELNSVNNKVVVLETYTADGKNIDARVLDFGFEEYGNPAGSVNISSDLSIYIYAITTVAEYDENGNEISGTQKQKRFFINGRILEDGKIQLSETDSEFLK